MNLINVCYKQIKDNFWYGIFGDFKLVIDKNTGYFNATKLCKSGGKMFYHWSRLDGSKALISCVEKAAHHIWRAASYEIIGNNNDELNKQTTGTYVHKTLILSLASWISPEFYVKCNEIVLNYYVQDFNRIKNSNTELENRINEIEESLAKLSMRNIELARQNEQLKPIAAPYTIDSELHNCFLIFRKNKLNEEFPYGVIRIKKRNLYLAMKRVTKRYPEHTVVYKKIQDPNSIKLYHLMIQQLDIVSKGYSFKTKMSEEELVAEVDSLYEQLLQ